MSFYDEASWVLIPEGIKEDVVYAQKPTDGLGDLAFTRASDATRTNSAGVIERTPWNLFQFSEMFSDAYWTKLNATITANNAVAPDGTSSADRLVLTSVSPASQTISRQVAIVSSTTTVTFSTFVKYVDKQYIQLVFSGGFSLQFANFDLINGTVTAGTYVSANVQSYADGWYRISITTTGLNTNVLPFIWSIDTALAGRAADSTSTGTSSYLIWGAQLVEGTDAKPYFATTNRQDVPRLDYRNADGTLNSCPRLLLEPQRTNSIRNSTMVGAVAGSPGTLPTNWNQSGGGGLTTTISLGTENGLSYVDIRYNGTATQSFLELRFEGTTAIAALTAQTWTASAYLKAISGTIPTSQLTIIERTAAGGFITQGSTLSTPTSTLQRFTLTRTLSGGATVAFVQPLILFTLTIGATYDFTIRIAAPQMELGAYATTFIPTTTAAVTRLADGAIKTGVSDLIGQTEGTIFLNFQYEVAQQARFSLSDGTGNNWIFLSYPEAGTSSRVYVNASGIIQINNSTGSVFAVNQTYKLAFAYRSGSWALYINGTSIASGTQTFAFNGTLNRITVTSTSTPSLSEIFAKINQSALFKTRLTNARLAEITTL